MQEAEFAWWANALKGVQLPIDPNTPESGYYRLKTKNTATGKVTAKPVAIWRDAGEMLCRSGDVMLSHQRTCEIWPYLAKNPVSYESYKQAAETGEWPDVHNISPSAETLSGRTDGAPAAKEPQNDALSEMMGKIDAAKAGLSKYAEIDSDEMAGAAQSLRSQVLEVKNEAERTRVREKQPHLDASRAIDGKWKPVVDAAETVANSIRSALTRWETIKRDAARAAEARRQNEESLALVTGQPAAETKSNAPPPSAKIRGGVGRAASVGTEKEVTIDNQDAVYAFFRDNPDVAAVLLKLAKASVKAGIVVPGTSISEKVTVK